MVVYRSRLTPRCLAWSAHIEIIGSVGSFSGEGEPGNGHIGSVGSFSGEEEPGNGHIGSVGSLSGEEEPGNGHIGSVGSFSGGGGTWEWSHL